ncbi:MAG: hypothetical protein KF886_15160 [Candidatus Hydrogenedentes bacterium]|nr:hypothetical protein [Candidatus Hydrogenedentota bacterium]
MNPGLTAMRPATIFLVALSLSIGWGIRGNFGHEYGAMIPGALAGLAVALLSGREDWRARAPYLAFFGALGWAFGGSMSYMQVVSYTHSGHLPSQIYGFFGVFVLGFLWAAMGGAGTAFGAIADRARLAEVFRPLCWIFIAWVIFKKFVLHELETLFPEGYDPTWSRQAAHTYWFDADWMETTTAILALLLFELWDNRWDHFRRGRAIVLLPLCIAAGALLGYGAQAVLNTTGAAPHAAAALVQYQVSPEFVARAAEERGLAEAEVLADQLINWPNAVLFFPHHVGWFVGALVGLGLYFFRYGRFASGASLFMHMALGWFACFLLFPVLLGHPIESGPTLFRMTPPRGDNWAGVLGVVVGTGVWLLRNGYVPVLFGMLLTGILGGVGFAGGALIKLMLVRPGNPHVEIDPAIIAQWEHWQRANWHSVMEQTHGFLHGVALAIAMGLLARRTSRNDGVPAEARWTAAFAAAFVLFGVTYLNMYKNVLEWVKNDLMPEAMPMPLFGAIQLSAWGWFNLIFAAAAIAGIALLWRHQRAPIDLVPRSALGRGQMLYVAFLAAVCVMNFERALTGFTDQRLITEGMIFLNATLATVLILILPRPGFQPPEHGQIRYGDTLLRTAWGGLVAVLITAFGMTAIVRAMYGGNFAGHANQQFRFGDEAVWRIEPTEKSGRHS